MSKPRVINQYRGRVSWGGKQPHVICIDLGIHMEPDEVTKILKGQIRNIKKYKKLAYGLSASCGNNAHYFINYVSYDKFKVPTDVIMIAMMRYMIRK